MNLAYIHVFLVPFIVYHQVSNEHPPGDLIVENTANYLLSPGSGHW